MEVAGSFGDWSGLSDKLFINCIAIFFMTPPTKHSNLLVKEMRKVVTTPKFETEPSNISQTITGGSLELHLLLKSLKAY